MSLRTFFEFLVLESSRDNILKNPQVAAVVNQHKNSQYKQLRYLMHGKNVWTADAARYEHGTIADKVGVSRGEWMHEAKTGFVNSPNIPEIKNHPGHLKGWVEGRHAGIPKYYGSNYIPDDGSNYRPDDAGSRSSSHHNIAKTYPPGKVRSRAHPSLGPKIQSLMHKLRRGLGETTSDPELPMYIPRRPKKGDPAASYKYVYQPPHRKADGTLRNAEGLRRQEAKDKDAKWGKNRDAQEKDSGPQRQKKEDASKRQGDDDLFGYHRKR